MDWDGPAIVWGFWMKIWSTWKYGFFSVYIHACVCLSVYLSIYTNLYSTVPEHGTEDWQSDSCQTGFGEVWDVFFWVNQYFLIILGMIQD